MLWLKVLRVIRDQRCWSGKFQDFGKWTPEGKDGPNAIVGDLLEWWSSRRDKYTTLILAAMDPDDSRHFGCLRASVFDGESNHDGQAACCRRLSNFSLSCGRTSSLRILCGPARSASTILAAVGAIGAIAESGNRTTPGIYDPAPVVFDDYGTTTDGDEDSEDEWVS
jgi:hypothetical protein